MIIEPLKNKKGEIMTNVEAVKHASDVLQYLKTNHPYLSTKQNEDNYLKWLEICGGELTRANTITDFFKSIADEKDERLAQLKLSSHIIGLK